MEICLADLKSLPIDWESMGIYGLGGEASWCTPVGGTVLMDTCQDGVHFCLLPDGVYLVDPYAQPSAVIVAEDLAHFLALLAATANIWAIAQIRTFTAKQYHAWLADAAKAASADRSAQAAKTLRNAFQLPEIADPYHDVKQLQATTEQSVAYAPAYYQNTGLPSPDDGEEIYEESDIITCFIPGEM